MVGEVKRLFWGEEYCGELLDECLGSPWLRCLRGAMAEVEDDELLFVFIVFANSKAR